MKKHLDRDIEHLKDKVRAMGARVEGILSRSLSSLNGDNLDSPVSISQDDIDIDCEKEEIEEECLKILALHQPPAFETAMIMSVLKISHELERIGDVSVKLANQSSTFKGLPSQEPSWTPNHSNVFNLSGLMDVRNKTRSTK